MVNSKGGKAGWRESEKFKGMRTRRRERKS